MLFAVKAFVTAALLIAFMQIQIGGSTIESRTEDFMRSNQATVQLRHVAEGAIKVTGDFWKKALGWAGLKSEAKPVSRSKSWNVEFRHKTAASDDDGQ